MELQAQGLLPAGVGASGLQALSCGCELEWQVIDPLWPQFTHPSNGDVVAALTYQGAGSGEDKNVCKSALRELTEGRLMQP